MKRVTLASLFVLMLLSISAFAQVAAVPPMMNFQGRLARPDGTPVPDGTYSVRFSLWDADSAGTEIWNQTIDPVTVRNGAFAVFLSGFAADTFNNNTWLEIKIGADAALTPRKQLVSVAYAMKANTVADGSITSASIANGSITAEKLATGVGNPLAWLLGGNAGTTGTQFLGTTDTQPLAFRTNNIEQMRLLSSGLFGIGTTAPSARTHIVGGPTWTSNGWAKSLAINNAGALELGYGTGSRFGLGASGGNLYLFTTPSEATADAANYRMTMNGTNGYVGVGTPGLASFPFTLQTNGGFGFMHTSGAVSVGTYASTIGGWFGTYSNHPLYFYTNNSQPLMTIDTAGRVGIGTTTPSYTLDVNGSAHVATTGGIAINAFSPNSNGLLGSSTTGVGVQGSSTSNDGVYGLSSSGWGVRGFSNSSIGVYGGTNSSSGAGVYGQGSGNGYAVYANGNAGGLSQWFNLSDARYKTNIHTLGNALEDILQLRGVAYDWDRAKWPTMNFTDGKQIGFIAQELEKILPQCVHTDSKGYKSVSYANVVPVLVEAVKTLKKDNDALKAKNEALEARLNSIENALAELKAHPK